MDFKEPKKPEIAYSDNWINIQKFKSYFCINLLMGINRQSTDHHDLS